MWWLKKIQRVMKMMKIEPENLAGQPQKVGVKRAKIFLEVISVKRKHSAIANHTPSEKSCMFLSMKTDAC